MIVFPLLDPVKTAFIHAAPAVSPEIWWITGLVFLILVLTAGIDAFTAIIPDVLIFPALLAITAMLGLYGSWSMAAHQLGEGIASGIIIWAINEIWFRLFRTDALGMGDAKWTMLATTCFGWVPSFYAWEIGACVAVVWMGVARLFGYQLGRVTFGPFLLIGLCAGLCWLRLFASHGLI